MEDDVPGGKCISPPFCSLRNDFCLYRDVHAEKRRCKVFCGVDNTSGITAPYLDHLLISKIPQIPISRTKLRTKGKHMRTPRRWTRQRLLIELLIRCIQPVVGCQFPRIQKLERTREPSCRNIGCKRGD